LISAIYDAAVDGESWARLPKFLADYVDGETCAAYSTAPGAVTETATHGMTGAAADYVAYFHRVEPWNARWYQPWTGPIRTWDIADPAVLAETEYYRDFARHWGMYHVLGASWPVASDSRFSIALHRPQHRPDFSPETFERFAGIVPHMQRMAQLRRRLSAAEKRATIGFAAVDALAFAAVICTAGGGVVFANAAARALSADKGLALGGQEAGLRALLPAETAALRSLVRSAASGGSGGAMRLTGSDGAVLLALVSPLPPVYAEAGSPARLALVAIKPSSASPSFGHAVLKALFGLSPAETELASLLVAGRSIEEIAMERRVSPATARTQLRNIFAKTGAESQKDLVGLLASLPQLR
jgi:DNA-binding CsgD family transcriptional regulator